MKTAIGAMEILTKKFGSVSAEAVKQGRLKLTVSSQPGTAMSKGQTLNWCVKCDQSHNTLCLGGPCGCYFDKVVDE